jgi:[ribosomal protein S18]-alanine N-acetyltransferase
MLQPALVTDTYSGLQPMIRIVPFTTNTVADNSAFNDPDAVACANAMYTSEPWITLGLTPESALAIASDPALERYKAIDGNEQHAGFILINTGAQFPGYIKILCVTESSRGKGVGRQLMEFAEDRIFREFPNVFLCVSSFNHKARKFYSSLGYHEVGELTDYLIAGHAEILLRKTIGPRTTFRPGQWRPITSPDSHS